MTIWLDRATGTRCTFSSRFRKNKTTRNLSHEKNDEANTHNARSMSEPSKTSQRSRKQLPAMAQDQVRGQGDRKPWRHDVGGACLKKQERQQMTSIRLLKRARFLYGHPGNDTRSWIHRSQIPSSNEWLQVFPKKRRYCQMFLILKSRAQEVLFIDCPGGSKANKNGHTAR